jgi:hypothetical protein
MRAPLRAPARPRGARPPCSPQTRISSVRRPTTTPPVPATSPIDLPPALSAERPAGDDRVRPQPTQTPRDRIADDRAAGASTADERAAIDAIAAAGVRRCATRRTGGLACPPTQRSLADLVTPLLRLSRRGALAVAIGETPVPGGNPEVSTVLRDLCAMTERKPTSAKSTVPTQPESDELRQRGVRAGEHTRSRRREESRRDRACVRRRRGVAYGS